MLLAALLVWQLLLVTWSFNQASNAARTASRADGRGGSGEKAGKAALSPGLRKHAKVEMAGRRPPCGCGSRSSSRAWTRERPARARSAELPG